MSVMMHVVKDWFTDCTLSCSSVLLSVAVLVVTYVLYNLLFGKNSWEKYGVKQVSLGRLALVDFNRAMVQMIEKHGDTIGIDNGQMMLVTRDLDLLRQVMVKDFNNFVDRLPVLTTTSAMGTGVFFLNSHDWRRVRHVITPSFTTGKLKQVAQNIEDSARKLTSYLEQCARNGDLIGIKGIAGQFTSEIIARSAFGLKTDCIGKEDDDFTRHAKKMFKIRGKVMSIVMLIMFRYKALHNFLVKKLGLDFLDQVDSDADQYFNSIIHTAVAERQELERQEKPKPRDLFQSLIAAKEEGDKETASFSVLGSNSDVSWEKLPKTMSDRELMGQSMLIILAGFETTATTMQMALYLLASHPDIQEKVYEEIKEVVSSESPTYEQLGQLKYLEQVINETLRLYPPAPVISRKAAETWNYKNITIPKGVSVIIPMESIMRNPKNFPDPTKFDPERFSEENKSERDYMSFLPFGQGPRHCIGMRLAYLELKMGLVYIMRKVKFAVSDRTQPKVGEKLETGFQGLIVIEKPIQLEVHLRDEK